MSKLVLASYLPMKTLDFSHVFMKCLPCCDGLFLGEWLEESFLNQWDLVCYLMIFVLLRNPSYAQFLSCNVKHFLLQISTVVSKQCRVMSVTSYLNIFCIVSQLGKVDDLLGNTGSGHFPLSVSKKFISAYKGKHDSWIWEHRSNPAFYPLVPFCESPPTETKAELGLLVEALEADSSGQEGQPLSLLTWEFWGCDLSSWTYALIGHCETQRRV